jgi:hypothetical protein
MSTRRPLRSLVEFCRYLLGRDAKFDAQEFDDNLLQTRTAYQARLRNLGILPGSCIVHGLLQTKVPTVLHKATTV